MKKPVIAPLNASDEWMCETCKKTFTKKQMVWREDKKGKKTNRWCARDYFKQ